MQLA
jgi:tetratricopeptide repeat protein 21B